MDTTTSSRETTARQRQRGGSGLAGLAALMLMLAACDPSPLTDDHEGALERARASLELQRSQARLQETGWQIGAPQVERYLAPVHRQAGGKGAAAPGAGGGVEWTRVTVPVSRSATPGLSAAAGRLLLAWPHDGGAEVLAVWAEDDRATSELLASLGDQLGTAR